ncbi:MULTISPECIES: phosphoribosylanthranilate isomerase [unclassified Legionella]|uniref:phosphoribosylanthranilate isomerase n=1 Tax=unclassified Legionella TaxID=2622702 RepID=UPI0010549E64|nr:MULTISPECIES: phosphoribosylanthranilate isomerase [unclassified Legionella]MDI9818266.1 phosphoribosylanthranilate isomerase [Legionella sp. PL877]
MAENRVRIKMCGMTRREDIAHAVALGVDAIGLIFYSGSSRHISIEQARLLLKDVPLFVDIVAVFVNPLKSLVDQVINELPVQWLQFHGEETPAFCNQFQIPYIKSIQAASADVISQLAIDYQQASAILLDTPSDNYGGTGKTFNWGIIPVNLKKPFILAGGLDFANVTKAVGLCSPYAVDVCSGVELSAGIKDHEKMSQFVNALWGKA